MNIVFVSKECPPSTRSCGIGTYVWETGHALARLGHNVTIIAAADDGRQTSSEPSSGLTVIRLPDDEVKVEKRSMAARLVRAPLEQELTYRRRIADCIAALVARQQVDIIEFPGFRGESIAWLAGERSLPMVVRVHGPTAGVGAIWKDHISATRRLRLAWESAELRAANAVTTVSECQASYVRRKLRRNRVQVVHNSIDTDRWRKLSTASSQQAGSRDILFVGSLLANKGIFALLRASNLLRQKGWRGRLLLAGRTSPEFERFLRLRAVLRKPLPDWVVRLGVCQREHLAGLYRDAGVCCFPSLHESFSYTCLEAMSCGGIVVGSLGTGMTEILTDACGFLAPPGSVSALAAALTSALALDEDKRTRMKETAQQTVQQQFDNSAIIPRLLNVYSETIEAAARSRSRC